MQCGLGKIWMVGQIDADRETAVTVTIMLEGTDAGRNGIITVWCSPDCETGSVNEEINVRKD